ncbi:hypothetical protein GOAMI_49_00560 [Gordonia amicalis NBRC 100051 = JCM 11271]|nr:hypothetical protein GOAMI_49_00560 [Gordonia amicalis NBRC 100051 = JCM 11271]
MSYLLFTVGFNDRGRGDAEVCGESKDQVKRYVPAALNLGDVLARDPDGSSGLCLGLPAQLAQRTKAEAYRTQVVATVPNIHAPTICDGGDVNYSRQCGW